LRELVYFGGDEAFASKSIKTIQGYHQERSRKAKVENLSANKKSSLLALGVHGCGHTSDDFPCAVVAEPSVVNRKRFRFGVGRFWSGPRHFDSVIASLVAACTKGAIDSRRRNEIALGMRHLIPPRKNKEIRRLRRPRGRAGGNGISAGHEDQARHVSHLPS
jgi:hypothetical protein